MEKHDIYIKFRWRNFGEDSHPEDQRKDKQKGTTLYQISGK
jgi:hypothetical protein